MNPVTVLGSRWQLVRETLTHRGWFGSLDTARRLLCVLLHWRQHRRLLSVLKRPALGPLLTLHPRLPYRYTMPYLAIGHSLDQRRRMLQGHYQLMAERFAPVFMRQVLQDGLPLWSRDTSEGRVHLRMEGPCRQTRHREGELTLILSADTTDLYWLSFSLVPASALASSPETTPGAWRSVAFVGRVQGAPHEIDRMRRITRALHDVAPQDLLMSALSGLGERLGVQTVMGVSQWASVSRDLFEEAPMSFDYDAFWQRYHGERATSGRHFRVPLPFCERPIEGIAARHRGRTLDKRRFKRDVQQEIGLVVARHLKEAAGSALPS